MSANCLLAPPQISSGLFKKSMSVILILSPSAWAYTHLKPTAILLDEIVIHSADQMFILIQNLSLE